MNFPFENLKPKKSINQIVLIQLCAGHLGQFNRNRESSFIRLSFSKHPDSDILEDIFKIKELEGFHLFLVEFLAYEDRGRFQMIDQVQECFDVSDYKFLPDTDLCIEVPYTYCKYEAALSIEQLLKGKHQLEIECSGFVGQIYKSFTEAIKEHKLLEKKIRGYLHTD